jgi:Protein of unknown function (DUF2809)
MFTKYYLRHRLLFLINILTIVPLGYIVRFGHILPEFISDAGGSIAYEIFWILSIVTIFPRANIRITVISVCLATCSIEFLQLYQPPWLQAIRATLPGRLVLGTTFSWQDFPPYFVGCALGLLLVGYLDRVASGDLGVSSRE